MTGHIGINLLWMIPGVVGGSEEYSVRTVGALLDRRLDDLEVTVFALESFRDAHPEICERVDVVTLDLSGNRAVRLAAESTWLAAQARRLELDLVHHVGGRCPAIRSVPAVVTVHDLQPLVIPENFGMVKSRYLSYAIPRSVKAARTVIAPSEYVRGELLRQFQLDPDRVVAVSAGYEVPRLPSPDDPRVPDTVRELLAAEARFFVYPAVTHPHKKHETVLRAFAQLRDDGGDAWLVLTGGAGKAASEVQQLVADLDIGDRVRHLGRIDREVLDLLIARAEALVFPSEFEGFGIPILEAMALGCPVIAADATAVPEVVGSAGILVPPGDIGAWARVMGDRLAGTPPRAEAAAAGREQAARFAWERSGERLELVYRKALG